MNNDGGEKTVVDKLVRDLVFRGYATREFRCFGKRWRFKTLTLDEHRDALSLTNAYEGDVERLVMLKLIILEKSLIAINDVIVDAKQAEMFVETLTTVITDKLYECYEKLEYEQLTAIKQTDKLSALVESSFDRIKYKVMRAVGALPTEQRVVDMSEIQWMWYYLNIIEDLKETEDATKVKLDYLAFFINPELFKSSQAQQNKGKNGRTSAHTVVSGNTETIYHDTKVNDDFDAMLAEAMNGEIPTELPDDVVKGDAYESKEDFLDRVFNAEGFVKANNDAVLKQANALAEAEHQAKSAGLNPADVDVIEIDE